MKIIDLLVLIANKEYKKLPKKIKYDDCIFILDENDYVCEDDNFINCYETGYLFCHLFELPNDVLNIKVEIIEEDKLEEIKELDMVYSGNEEDEIMRNRYRINELTKIANYLLEKEGK